MFVKFFLIFFSMALMSLTWEDMMRTQPPLTDDAVITDDLQRSLNAISHPAFRVGLGVAGAKALIVSA
jgi:hypothetical protein